MRTRAIRSLVAGWAAVVGGTASLAHAGFTQYDLFYSAYYTQFSGAAPDPAFAARAVSARLMTDGAPLLDAATVQPPGGAEIPLPDQTPTDWLYFSPVFASEGAMFAAFPAGVYTYRATATGGGTQSATLTRGGNLFCAEVPAFDADTADTLLSSPDAAQDLVVNFNGWTPVAGANDSVTFLTVVDANSNAEVINTFAGPNVTQYVIAGGTLEPGGDYFISLFYSSRAQVFSAGFGTARSIVGFDRVTSLFFSTAPASVGCVKDYNRDQFYNLDDLGDFITDFYNDPPIPGGAQADAPTYSGTDIGFGTPCPDAGDAPSPYDVDAFRGFGYRVGYSPDGSNACPLDPSQPFPNLDNLNDFITLFYDEQC